MAEPKTKLTDEKVDNFLNKIPDEQKRKDSFAILELMKEITKCEPRMWGTSIVGFGTYHYVYASGREGDWPMTGFSPRKQNLTLYIMPGFSKYDDLMKKLGKHSIGKSCLYIKRLSDIDMPTLKKLVQESFKRMKKIYP
jgi:hypothetical protein